MTTYFGEEYNQSILNIPISSNVSASDLNSYSKSVEDIAFLLNQEVIPVKYTMNGSALFIGSNFNENIMNIFYWSIVIALVIILIVLFIKFGSAGLLAGILNAALIGLLTLVLKYVKVTISISSMVAFFGVMLLNLIFLVLYLKKLKEQKENAYLETMKVFYSINFPVIVVAFIFTFFVSATVRIGRAHV